MGDVETPLFSAGNGLDRLVQWAIAGSFAACLWNGGSRRAITYAPHPEPAPTNTFPSLVGTSRERACNTQTRPSPAAIAGSRLRSPGVNRSSTQAEGSITRQRGARTAGPHASSNDPGARAAGPCTLAATRPGAAMVLRRDGRCTALSAGNAGAKRACHSSRAVIGRSTARSVSRPSGARDARRTVTIASAYPPPLCIQRGWRQWPVPISRPPLGTIRADISNLPMRACTMRNTLLA